MTDVNDYENNNIRIYPNPAVDFIDISLNSEVDGEIKIFNLFGELMISLPSIKNSDICRINIQDLNPGFYVIEANKHRFKFIKN